MEKKLELLLCDRYRPQTIDDLILPQRVKKYFSKGLIQNVILHGQWGIGKTSLARILISKYTKTNPHIEINSSFYTSIDTLRGKIDDFCSKVFIDFDTDFSPSLSYKYVFLDEFDRTSSSYQDALKAYIEDYSSKGVRFILSTNHLEKISPGIQSRFVNIDCSSQTAGEEKEMKIELFKKIWEKIVPTENIPISKEDLLSLIKNKFPDIRTILLELEYWKNTGESSSHFRENGNLTDDKIYDLVFDDQLDYQKIYHIISDRWTGETIGQFLDLFGQKFILWHLKNKPSEPSKLFVYNQILSEAFQSLQTDIDPIVSCMSFIGKMRNHASSIIQK